MKQFKVLHDADQGFYLAKRVDYPGGTPAFWQQVSPYYITARGIKDFIKRGLGTKWPANNIDLSVLETYEKRKQARFLLSKVQYYEAMLSEADNNLRYITALKGLYLWLNRLHMLQDFLPEYECKQYFEKGASFTFYERVYYSLQEYKNGNRPF